MLRNEKEMGNMLPPYWWWKMAAAMNLLCANNGFAQVDHGIGEYHFNDIFVISAVFGVVICCVKLVGDFKVVVFVSAMAMITNYVMVGVATMVYSDEYSR